MKYLIFLVLFFSVISGFCRTFPDERIGETNGDINSSRRIYEGVAESSVDWTAFYLLGLLMHPTKNKIRYFKSIYAEEFESVFNSEDTEAFENNFSELEQLARQEIGDDEIIDLFYFYTEVAVCVNQGECDGHRTCNHFQINIAEDYMLFADLVDSWNTELTEIDAFLKICSTPG